MTIYQLANQVLQPLGITIPEYSQLVEFNPTQWFELLRVDYILGTLLTLAVAYPVIYVLFVLPFRWFKHLVKAPDRKGKR